MNDLEESVVTEKEKKHVMAKPKSKKQPGIIKNITWTIRMLSIFSARWAGEFAFYIYARPRKSKKKKLEKVLEDASIHFVPFDGGKIKVYSWGTSSKQVLLMHGWESRAVTFREMIPVFLENNLSVVAIDAPAHGGSSGKTTNLVKWGKAVVEVIGYYDCMGKPIRTAVAHSFGGSAILNMAIRKELSLDKLVTISSPFFFHTYFNFFCHLFNISKKVQRHMLAKADRIIGESFMNFDLTTRAREASIGQLMAVHDEGDTVISIEHLYRMKEKTDDLSFFISKGLGHYQIIKDRHIIERIAGFLIN